MKFLNDRAAFFDYLKVQCIYSLLDCIKYVFLFSEILGDSRGKYMDLIFHEYNRKSLFIKSGEECTCSFKVFSLYIL